MRFLVPFESIFMERFKLSSCNRIQKNQPHKTNLSDVMSLAASCFLHNAIEYCMQMREAFQHAQSHDSVMGGLTHDHQLMP